MPPYVSDVLEPLLAAADARSAVREHCACLLDSLEPHLQRRLGRAAHYVGGKCMGYPAIWLLQMVLEPRGASLRAIVDRSEPALTVSLTTSIVDDLMDRDEPVDEECVGLLYLLMTSAAFRTSSSSDIAAAQRAFLGKALDVCAGSGEGPDADTRRGDRIGHFFRMIAAGPASAWLSGREADALVEATGRFGAFCAHLDDWIDRERDEAAGVSSNVAVRLRRELLEAPSNGRRRHDDVRALSSRMKDVLIAQLREIRPLLDSIHAREAIAALDAAESRIEGCIADVEAARVRDDWMHAGLRHTLHT